MMKITGLAVFSYLALLALSSSKDAAYQPLVTMAAGAVFFLCLKAIHTLYGRYGSTAVFWGVLIAGGVLRFAWAVAVPTEPVSDFLYFHKSAIGLAQGRDLVTKNMGYTLLLSVGYRIHPNVLTGKLINAIASTASLAFIYSAGTQIVQKPTALLAMTLLALLPSEIAMVSVLGTDTLATTLGIIVLYLMLQAADQSPIVFAVCALCAGLYYGLSLTVRFSALFFLPAIVLWFLWLGRPKIGKMAQAVALFSGGVLGGILVMLMGTTLSTGHGSLKALQAQDSFPFLAGTNIETAGTWNQDDAKLYASWPEGERDALARREALRRVTSRPGDFLAIIPEKFLILMGPNNYAGFWSLQELVGETQRTRFALLSQAVYSVILFFAACAYAKSNNTRLLAVILVLTLCALLPHTILEVQGRYHHGVMPFFALLAAEGMQRISRNDDKLRALTSLGF